MSGKNRFKDGLKSLMRFTPLGRALVWEALIRWKKKETGRGEDGFKIADITDKWGTHHSSVKNQIECLTREGWLTIRKLEGERPVWILPKKRQEILGDWLSMHLDNLAKAVHIPQFPLVANWLFEELREGAKSVHLLRNKLKELKFGEEYAQSNSYKTAKEWGVETTLNRIIESTLRFFGSYVGEEFRGRGGKRTFYFRLKDEPPLITADQWRLEFSGELGDGVEAKQTRLFGVDLSTGDYVSPGTETAFTLSAKQKWRVTEIEKKDLNHKIGNMNPRWAPFKFTDKKLTPRVDSNCLNCKETIRLNRLPEVTIAKSGLSLKKRREIHLSRPSGCVMTCTEICKLFRKEKPHKDVIVLWKCPKGIPRTTLSIEMFVPTSFS